MLTDLLLVSSGRLWVFSHFSSASVLVDRAAQSSWEIWPKTRHSSKERKLMHGGEIQMIRRKRRRKIAHPTRVMMRRKLKRDGRRSKRPSSMVIHSTMDIKVMHMRSNTRTWVQMVWIHSTSSMVEERLSQDLNNNTLCLNLKDKVLEDLHSFRFQWTCSSKTCNEDLLRAGTRHSCSTTDKVELSHVDKIQTT